MALYLVQHGQSLSKQVDPEQNLSEKGRAEVERIARVAADYAVPVGVVLHSEKDRARQTAELMAKYLHPEQGLEEVPGLKPLDEIMPWAEKVADLQSPMLVGHLPFLQKLLAYLVAGDEQKQIFKFQNGGIVCLDQDEQEDWLIKWALMPHIK